MDLRALNLAAIFLLLTTACASRPALDSSGREVPLEQRQQEFLDALAARDLERTLRYFADDAVLHVANRPPLRGRPAIHEFYSNVFRFIVETVSSLDQVREAEHGGMAWSTGTVTNVFEVEQARAHHAGKFLLIWEERAGNWLITAYSISSDRTEDSP